MSRAERLQTYLGNGILSVPEMLDARLANQIEQDTAAGRISPSPADGIGLALWRELMGAGPAATEEERMYEVEAAQVIVRTTNRTLTDGAQGFVQGALLTAAKRTNVLRLLADEPDVSSSLRKKIASAQ